MWHGQIPSFIRDKTSASRVHLLSFILKRSPFHTVSNNLLDGDHSAPPPHWCQDTPSGRTGPAGILAFRAISAVPALLLGSFNLLSLPAATPCPEPPIPFGASARPI